MTDVISPFRRASASQMKAFRERGPRYWYFKWRMRLAQVERDYFTFGTRLHGVAERWLGADDILDRDLYPDGWDAGLQPSESDLVKVLFDEAVETGRVDRQPGRHVELKFDGVEIVDGITLVGYIDLLNTRTDPPEVLDHKSCKSPSYALSKNKLRKDWQTMLYAKMLLLHMEETGVGGAPEVRLTLLYYFKTPGLKPGKRTRRVSVVVSREEIETAWGEMRDCVREMILVGQVESWRDVPCNGSSCAYRKCPYVYICGGEETPERYSTRVNELNSERVQSRPDASQKEVPMAGKNKLLDSLKRKKEEAGGSKTAKEAAKSPGEKAAQEKVSLTPPWAIEGCAACGGKGWNTKKNPCRICVNRTHAKGGETPDSKTIKVVGPCKWERVEAAAETPAETPAEPSSKEEVKSAVKGLQALMSKGKKDTSAAEPDPPAAPEQPEGASTEPAPPKRGRGRPKGAQNKPKYDEPFILVIGAVPSNTDRPVVDLTTLMVELGDEMAKEFGAESYYALDAWERRDALGRRALKIIERVPNGALVYCADDSPDLKALVSALRPFTGTIIQAVK